MKAPIAITMACLWLLFTQSPAHAEKLPPAMKKLCKKADKDRFIPLPQSILHPHGDPVIHGIEMLGDYNYIKELIAQIDPDSYIITTSGISLTPMLTAAIAGNWPAARALIEKGADVNFTKPPLVEYPPLSAALLTSKFSFACKLIENGARLPSENSDRQELFRDALIMIPGTEQDGAVFIDYLIDNGFDVNDMGHSRETPLMGVVATANIPIIKLLLKRGARLDIVKKGDRTVWGVAVKKNNPQVLKLLKEAQQKANGMASSP